VRQRLGFVSENVHWKQALIRVRPFINARR
jgi:hypothetical protein